MRLYLDADTKSKRGYTPDWIRVEYTTEDNKDIELTMDVQGWIDYSNDKLEVRVKGELIPWTCSIDGEEVDLSEQESHKELMYIKMFGLMLRNPDAVVVGVYPTDDKDVDTLDVFTNCEGTYEYMDDDDNLRTTSFTFTCEINV